MNLKNIKVIFIIVGLLSIFSLAWTGNLIKKSLLTDSGFDISYSGGGSSSSGSSYSSGSSSSSSSNDRSFTFDFSSPVNTICSIVAIVVIIMPFFIFFCVMLREKRLIENNILSKKMTEEEAREIIPNINLNEFLQDRVIDYIKIQNDWSNFNYDGLKENLTDELYNQYCMQLKTLEIKNQRNVMSDFTKKDVGLVSLKNVNGRYEATIELVIWFYDYIVKGEKVVRGSNKSKMKVHYKMLFVSSSDDIINKCPSCGADLGDNNSETCPYCHNNITRLTNKWVLSKKRVLF